MTKFSGKCLCGNINYHGDGEPMFAGNCHCTDCCKASGAGHMSLFAVPESAVEISGEIKGYDIEADSGATVTHHFCPNCGVRIFNASTNMPGVKVIVASTLDDPEFYKPALSVYASRALSWDQPNPAAPAFDTMPPMDN